MSQNGITLRWASHELIGERVTDQAGRVGRLAAVLEHVADRTGKVVRAEAHLRPVDGSGWEWTAEAGCLTRVECDGERDNRDEAVAPGPGRAGHRP